MKLNANSTFGQYKWSVEANVTDAQRDILASLGLLQVYQRVPASNAEKRMAGYEKRPKGFERKSIPFTETGVETLVEELEKPVEIADGIKISATVSAEFHEIGKTETKFAEERKAYAVHATNGTLEKFAKKIGYTGDIGDGQEPPETMLQHMRDWVKEQLKGLIS